MQQISSKCQERKGRYFQTSEDLLRESQIHQIVPNPPWSSGGSIHRNGGAGQHYRALVSRAQTLNSEASVLYLVLQPMGCHLQLNPSPNHRHSYTVPKSDGSMGIGAHLKQQKSPSILLKSNEAIRLHLVPRTPLPISSSPQNTSEISNIQNTLGNKTKQNTGGTVSSESYTNK